MFYIIYSSVVRLWLLTGRITGLIYVDVDLKAAKFYTVKYYGLYSFVFAVVATVMYPIAYVKLSNQVSLVEEVDIIFSIVVSAIRDAIDYTFMIFALHFHMFNRNNLTHLLNDVWTFVDESEKDFKCLLRQQKRKMKIVMSIGIVIKLTKVFIHVATVMLISGADSSQWISLLFITIPKLAVFVVLNEYFAGVLVLKKNIETFNQLLELGRRKMKFTSPEKLTMLNHELELCDFFERMSTMHSKLFKMYKTFSGMYQFQVLLLIVSTFFAMMIDMFYIFNVIFFKLIHLTSNKGFILKMLAIAAIIVRSYQIYFDLKSSNRTNKSHVTTRNVLARIACPSNWKGRDERLRQKVS